MLAVLSLCLTSFGLGYAIGSNGKINFGLNLKNEIIRTKTSKYSTNLSFQKFLWEKRNIKQKPTKLNLTPCRILSKTANHLSILKILIEIFKIPARNAPRILIYYMEKWTHQQKQREKFRKKRKISKERQKEVLWKI
mgnify:CR=1 FL=1